MASELTNYGRNLTLQLIMAGVYWDSRTQLLTFQGPVIAGIDVNRKFPNVEEAATYISGVVHDRVSQMRAA